VARRAAAAADAPLDIQIDHATGKSLNYPEDPQFSGYNSTHAIEVCRDPLRLSVAVSTPPPGRGLHPNVPAVRCIAYTTDTEYEVVPCRGTTEIGVPSPTAEVFVKAWCDRCVHELTGDVDGLTAWLLPAYNVQAMGLGDYVTYIFAALVVALTIVGEQKGVCDID